jgi:hypothetical protein
MTEVAVYDTKPYDREFGYWGAMEQKRAGEVLGLDLGRALDGIPLRAQSETGMLSHCL